MKCLPALLLAFFAPLSHANEGNQSAPVTAPNQSVSASANLDFVTKIGKFVFLRVGTGAYPAANPTIDTVAFQRVPIIQPLPTTPVNGNDTHVSWSRIGPFFSSAQPELDVEVYSNAGQVKIRATATAPLTSGTNTYPMSSITITSSDPINLPAPLVPNVGATTASVNVVGSSFNNLVTARAAKWKFRYNNGTNIPQAGLYTGEILFTASVL